MFLPPPLHSAEHHAPSSRVLRIPLCSEAAIQYGSLAPSGWHCDAGGVQGCGSSDLDFDQQWNKHGRAFQALKLTVSDAKMLWKIFQKMDLGVCWRRTGRVILLQSEAVDGNRFR